MRPYDEHAPCKEALDRAYQRYADGTRVKQVVQRDKNGDHIVLQVLRVDAFEDGLRILVQ